MNDDERAAIKKRAEAATPGPWEVEPDDGGHDMHGFATRTTIRTPEWARYGFDEADAEFIAHARTDVPALVAEVESLRMERANLMIRYQGKFDEAERLRAEYRRLTWIVEQYEAGIEAPG